MFNFFKRKVEPLEDQAKDKYWLLRTAREETADPSFEQIEKAVKDATPHEAVFVTLDYKHSGLKIECIQAVSEEGVYRFEALTTEGYMFVRNNLTYNETLELFSHFYHYQRVLGVESWDTEAF